MKKLSFLFLLYLILNSCTKTEVLILPTPQVVTKVAPSLYKIGDTVLGGKIAYILQQGDPGYDANLQHGLANTTSIISSQGETISTYAAGLARAYNGGGYDDWFLPSKDELYKLYINKVIIGGFVNTNYWSSSEQDDDFAYKRNFINGDQNFNTKVNTFHVRAIRAF
jgi:hypothetical protein